MNILLTYINVVVHVEQLLMPQVKNEKQILNSVPKAA